MVQVQAKRGSGDAGGEGGTAGRADTGAVEEVFVNNASLTRRNTAALRSYVVLELSFTNIEQRCIALSRYACENARNWSDKSNKRTSSSDKRFQIMLIISPD